MKQSELDWFRPLWRRVTVTVFVAAWCALEWTVWHDEMFRWITLAALAYAVWSFFITYDRRAGTPPDNPPPESKA